MRLEDLGTSKFDEYLGTELVEATPDRAVSVTPVRPELYQAFGIVHGGVYASIIESLASVAAIVWLGADSETRVVGVSNQTDFIRPVHSGSLRAEAAPLQRGRTFQIWEVSVTDSDGRLCAHGKVRLANLTGSQCGSDVVAEGGDQGGEHDRDVEGEHDRADDEAVSRGGQVEV